jgi:hypothetical protein
MVWCPGRVWAGLGNSFIFEGSGTDQAVGRAVPDTARHDADSPFGDYILYLITVAMFLS